jgi:hypothetical protein
VVVNGRRFESTGEAENPGSEWGWCGDLIGLSVGLVTERGAPVGNLPSGWDRLGATVPSPHLRTERKTHRDP